MAKKLGNEGRVRSVWRSITLIASATAISQAVLAASSPVLARLYSTSEFGIFFIVQSFALPMAAAMALRLELAIPIPKHDASARVLIRIALSTILGTWLLLMAAAVVTTLTGVDGSGGWASQLAVIASLAGAVSAYGVLSAVAAREQRYAELGFRHLLVAVVTVLLQFLGGLFEAGGEWLAVSATIAYLAGALLIYFRTRLPRTGSERGTMLVHLKEYRRFPLLMAPAGVLNSGSANAPVILVGFLFSVGDAGNYGMAMKMMAIPVALVGTSVSQVYIGEISSKWRSGCSDAYVLFKELTGRLAIAAAVMVVGTMVGAPWVFRTFFGEEWSLAGEVCRAFAFGAAAQLIVAPTSQSLVLAGRVRTQFFIDALRPIILVLSIIMPASLGGDVILCTWCLSAAMVFTYGINWLLCRSSIRRRDAKVDV